MFEVGEETKKKITISRLSPIPTTATNIYEYIAINKYLVIHFTTKVVKYKERVQHNDMYLVSPGFPPRTTHRKEKKAFFGSY